MSFSAVTCLSYTGTTPLGGVLNLYSNVDGYTTPFQTNINLSAITGNECPYYIDNVPDFTTQIRIYDIGTGCACDIPIQSNDICTTCDLDFNRYSATTVGRIFAGGLTGICNPSITDYRIYWYETGNTITPAYISGLGTAYTPYNFTHPLTGSSAIFAEEGTYLPVIDKIKISGLTFSQTGGTGLIPAELSCFETTKVTVDPFTCSNGVTSDDPNYTHRVNFLSTSVGAPSPPLQSTFLLTSTTVNYFAWKFKGFNVADRLRLTYSGSAYNTPILIEDMIIGDDLLDTDFSLNKVPKSADTTYNSFIKKVTCLTGLTRNIGDKIKLEIIPNTVNPQTIWDFYFTCLNSFSQDTCIISNNPYKISASTITSTTTVCGLNAITFKVSGCSRNTDDFSKYIAADNINSNTVNVLNNNRYIDTSVYSTNKILNVGSGNLSINRLFISIRQPKDTTYSPGIICSTPNTNVITYSKYISGGTGIIDMSFNDVSDFNAYYGSYLSIMSFPIISTTPGDFCSTSSGLFSGTPFDPTDVKYYRYFKLYIPSNTGSTNCGDGTTNRIFTIHPSSVVTTGTSGPNYTLRFTMPTIINSLTYDPCNPKSYVDNAILDDINTSSTATTNNFTGTTLTGSRFVDPFPLIRILCSGTTTYSAVTSEGYINYPKYLNETIPYTGITPTIVPSLSAKTFNFDYPRFTFYNIPKSPYYQKYTFSYGIRLNNPSDFRDFQIYANSFTGGTLGSSVLIYDYTGATSSSTTYNGSYFI